MTNPISTGKAVLARLPIGAEGQHVTPPTLEESATVLAELRRKVDILWGEYEVEQEAWGDYPAELGAIRRAKEMR